MSGLVQEISETLLNLQLLEVVRYDQMTETAT